MNKNIIFLIIIVLLLICSIGAYLFSNNSILENSILTNEFPKNDSNISVTESEGENNQDNATIFSSNDNTRDKSNNNNNNNNNNSNSNNNINNNINNQNSVTKTITSKSEVIKEANKILNSNKGFFGKNAVVNNVKYEGNRIWSVDFIDSKTGKKVGTTYIDDATGEMVNAM